MISTQVSHLFNNLQFVLRQERCHKILVVSKVHVFKALFTTCLKMSNQALKLTSPDIILSFVALSAQLKE